MRNKKKMRKLILFALLTIIFAILICFSIKLKKQKNDYIFDKKNINYSKKIIVVDRKPANEKIKLENLEKESINNLPEYLKYTEFNKFALKKYLDTRNSLIREEPYFEAIIEAAYEFDVNPLLLFAILGQEQGFVPKDNEYAYKIANNPFNVFGSWRDYNTDINDSAKIAAKTVVNLSKNCPEEENPIKWINLRGGEGGYAEDTQWWKGVESIFNKLVEITND